MKDKYYFHVSNGLANFKSQLTIGNRKLKESSKKNPLLSHKTSYDETEEEIIKYVVNRNGVDINKFIDIDRTQDLIKGADATLHYVPKDKGHFEKIMKNKTLIQSRLGKNIPWDKSLDELENGNNHQMNENFTGKNNLVRMEEEVDKMQESTINRNIISCANETNEDNDNNMGNLINGDKT